MFISVVLSHGVLYPFQLKFSFSNVVILLNFLLQMCCIILFGVKPPYPTYLCLIETTESSSTPYMMMSFDPAHSPLKFLREVDILFHYASLTACTAAVALDMVEL